MTQTPIFTFGTYLFMPARQLLLNGGEVVRIGCRALDLLAAFVQRPGELLTKRELLAQAWPSTTVVEGNLKVHIAALRRALDDDADAARYIATVNGRGYRFIAPVEPVLALTPSPPLEPAHPHLGEVRLPPPNPPGGGAEEIVSLLAKAMRSLVIDLPSEAMGGGVSEPPRRMLFIELTARDEVWIQDVFAQRLRTISAAR